MTTSAETTAATPPAKPTPIWEDIPDIFFAPRAVFERRRGGRFGKMLLVLLLILSVLGAASTWALAPAQAGDQSRMMSRMTQGNPEAAAAVQAAAARGPTVLSAVLGGLGTGFAMALAVFLVALAIWLLGIMFGASTSFGAGALIATYAYFPRILGQVAGIIQGLVMDPANLDSMFRVTASPARFFDPDTTSLIMLVLLSRFDLFVLWSTVLIGIGVYVIGRVSKAEAAGIALLVWVLGALPALGPAAIFGR